MSKPSSITSGVDSRTASPVTFNPSIGNCKPKGGVIICVFVISGFSEREARLRPGTCGAAAPFDFLVLDRSVTFKTACSPQLPLGAAANHSGPEAVVGPAGQCVQLAVKVAEYSEGGALVGRAADSAGGIAEYAVRTGGPAVRSAEPGELTAEYVGQPAGQWD